MPVGRGSVLESQTAHPLSDGEMTRAMLLPLNPAYSHSPWFSPPGESNVLFSHQINEGKSNEENNMDGLEREALLVALSAQYESEAVNCAYPEMLKLRYFYLSKFPAEVEQERTYLFI